MLQGSCVQGSALVMLRLRRQSPQQKKTAGNPIPRPQTLDIDPRPEALAMFEGAMGLCRSVRTS